MRNSDVTWVSWHLKSLVTWLLIQQLAEVNTQEYINTPPVFMKIMGHIGHFRWLGPNVSWEISQIWIEYMKLIGQMSDELWHFFGYTAPHYCPFVREIHQWQLDSSHKGQVMWKMFQWHVVITNTDARRTERFMIHSICPSVQISDFKRKWQLWQ